jgi:hypothetical protein
MLRAGHSSFALVVALASCSLITPLDFVGGTAGTPGVGGDGAGVGGGGAGSGGTAGTGGDGGAATGGGSGVGAGGGTEAGGTGGDDGGEAGDAGQGGAGDGGTGGHQGGSSGGGSAGASGGGVGGDTAGTSGGGGCAGADLGSDPSHCGMCGTMCEASEVCIDGSCTGSPCDGLCATWLTVPVAGDGYRMDDIGTAEQCFEVTGYAPTMASPALICWNFVDPRTIEINGVPAACMTEPGVPLPEERVGGYCVKVSAGDHWYAGFKFPLP